MRRMVVTLLVPLLLVSASGDSWATPEVAESEIADGDRVAQEHTDMQVIRNGVWTLGAQLAQAALINAQLTDPPLAATLWAEAAQLAAAISAPLPPLPTPTADTVSNLADAMHYLMDVAAQPIADTLQSTYGEQMVSIFELSSKVWMLLVLYVPGDSLGLSLADVVEREGTEIGIPATAWTPLVTAIRGGASSDDVSSLVFTFDEAATAYLLSAP